MTDKEEHTPGNFFDEKSLELLTHIAEIVEELKASKEALAASREALGVCHRRVEKLEALIGKLTKT